MHNDDLIAFLNSKLSKEVTNITSPRERRIFAETTTEHLVEVIRALKEWGMVNLGALTGLDLGEQFGVIYHLYDSKGLILNLKVYIPRNDPKVPTLTGLFPGVFLYERELMDLFGIQVEGTPMVRKYPVPEDWPDGQYPLRKDWKGLPAEKEVKTE